MSYLFTSESVSEGHPDKVCDAISDNVLDAILEKDPNARVACESFVTTGLALVGGEITTKAYIEVPDIVRADYTSYWLQQCRIQVRLRIVLCAEFNTFTIT